MSMEFEPGKDAFDDNDTDRFSFERVSDINFFADSNFYFLYMQSLVGSNASPKSITDDLKTRGQSIHAITPFANKMLNMSAVAEFGG